MNISDEAVEVAAKALFEVSVHAPDYWDDLDPVSRESWGEDAKKILEAAAPHMLAEVWEAGCRKGLSVNPGWEKQALASNPYRSQA